MHFYILSGNGYIFLFSVYMLELIIFQSYTWLVLWQTVTLAGLKHIWNWQTVIPGTIQTG